MTKIYLRTKLCLLLLLVFSFSAKADIFPFTATYSGANEVPPNASTATGTITGTYNDVTNTIYYTISFSGLGSNSTAAHFHGPAAPGVLANPPFQGHTGFPTGVTSGTYTGSHVFYERSGNMA